MVSPYKAFNTKAPKLLVLYVLPDGLTTIFAKSIALLLSFVMMPFIFISWAIKLLEPKPIKKIKIKP